MKKQTLKIIALILLPFFFLPFLGANCKKETNSTRGEPITLNWWRVNFDTTKDLEPIINAYKEKQKNVNIVVKTFTFAEYEEELLNAIAASSNKENVGPDILSIHNDWLPRWQNKLTPAPKSDKESTNIITARDYGQIFVETALDEFVDENNDVYAIPLSVDTLALFFNKDLLDSAGVSAAPRTWEEFNDAVMKLTQKATTGEILKSGGSIGTAKNVNRSTDILELLMLQNGTKMVNDDHTKATFNASSEIKNTNAPNETSNEATRVSTTDVEFVPGKNALEFYTDFANAKKQAYTWNTAQHNSIDAFAAGETAMMFNYSFLIEKIKAKSPNLNFGISYMPQVAKDGNTINYSNYWGEAVSSKTLYPDIAWDFVQFLGEKSSVQSYVEATNKPPSRRDLIDQIKSLPEIGIFAEQALSARNWWKPDNRQVEKIFAKMIEDINLGLATPMEAVNAGVNAVDQLMPEAEF